MKYNSDFNHDIHVQTWRRHVVMWIRAYQEALSNKIPVSLLKKPFVYPGKTK